jgi:hypothetical protein
MIQYNKSTIYKLCCKDANITEIYVGSTTNFRLRKSQHKSACNNENDKRYNTKVYKFIRDNGGFENWDMIEIEKVNATDKKNLEKHERRVIEELKPILNYQIPGRTKKEYYAENADKFKEYYYDNADKIKKRVKEYYAENADKIKEQQKKYNAENVDKIKEYNKVYRAENADKIKEHKKEYYAENSDKILIELKQKIDCKCGSSINKSGLLRHAKSKKHIQYLESLENIPYGSNFIFVD